MRNWNVSRRSNRSAGSETIEKTARERAIEDEHRRARQLRIVVDLTSAVLVQGRLSRREAEELVAAARHRALQLFPDKESTYELILAPRFARLIDEFVPAERRARILPFRRR